MRARCWFAPVWGVRYVVESTGIRLINTKSAGTHWLGYPEAAVWDMAVQGLDFERIVAAMQSIAGLDAGQAEIAIVDLFESLQRCGFLACEDESNP